MPFQVGDIKITGTIDDISFYHSSFGWLVRRKGGPTPEQFKTSPSFERSRENSSEFTNCSKAASNLRRIIIKLTGLKDKKLYHRLISLMRLLANNDSVSPRGSRDPMKGMHSSIGHLLLKNFEISPSPSQRINLYDVLLATGYFPAPKKIRKPPLRRKRILYIFRSSSSDSKSLSTQKQIPIKRAFG